MINYAKLFFFKAFAIIQIILFTNIQSSKAQNCTVNAGIDQSKCFSSDYNSSINYVNTSLFQLVGNTAGNVNATPNRLWQLVSAPAGANIAFGTPTANDTYVQSTYKDIPSGIYIFRLGVDCQTGGRVYDSVQVTITNVADFQMYADKKFSLLCGNSEDSVHLVSRPLKTGETLEIYANDLTLTSTNANTAFYTTYNGPTVDSVRFTVKNNNFTTCNTSPGAYFRYDIAKGGCNDYGRQPIVDVNKTPMGLMKPFLSKIGPKKTDSLPPCYDPNAGIYLPHENLCLKGGYYGWGDYINAGNVSVVNLTGSGTINVGSIGSGLQYQIINNWDTVTKNSLSTFELTFNGNGCFPTFKDTFKVFFRTTLPSLANFSFTNVTSNSDISYCVQGPFPLANYKFPLISGGTVPPQYKFNSVFVAKPSAANIANPNGKDTLNFTGTIMPGQYRIFTTVTDTITGCSILYITNLNILKQLQLPVLRDTIVCKSSLPFGELVIPYPTGTFGTGGSNDYSVQPINSSFSGTAYNNQISLNLNGNAYVGEFDVRVFPNASNPNACTDGKSDTFHISVKSAGHVSNAGTDQTLLCNVSTTNLAGSEPNNSGGSAGFWKFLSAISSNIGNPILIADTANKSTLVSGFINQSTYYFSWNVTDGNTGNYCNLKPDTVRIIYSGIAPSSAQAAQADFTGCLALNTTYNLTSNAVTPTFGVQWNQISGSSSTITNPNSTNTNVTGLALGIYKYEIVVTNACGIFKDTVTLNFTSNCSTLSAKLLSFSGSQNQNDDILFWNVASENNLKQYNVEISQDGNKFLTLKEILATTPSSANKSYTTTNNNVVSALNFYRLKMINIDGGFVYSGVLKLNRKEKLLNKMDVRPLPTTSTLYVTIQSANSYNTNAKIIDVLGKIVLLKNVEVLRGSNLITINVNTLPKGLYTLYINGMVNKIVVQ